jgi:hypothetical protein
LIPCIFLFSLWLLFYLLLHLLKVDDIKFYLKDLAVLIVAVLI